MIERQITPLLQKTASQFRSIAVIGPRQSGKTTLIRNVFRNKPYVSLENPEIRGFAIDDPRGFLNQYPSGAILDEIQRAPQLFSYLQQILDESSEDGLFILSGSNNFLLQEQISQSLAGRIGYVDLFPLVEDEIKLFNPNLSTTEILLNGTYPEVYDKQRDANFWYTSYVRTYVERDIREILTVSDTITFNKFLKLCAGRTGQLLNFSSFSNDAGIDQRTAQKWISALQASFIIYLLPPYYRNFNKRIVKSPKLFFVDTGLAAHLLNIKTADEYNLSHFKGALFENLVVSEILKQQLNKGKRNELYFWRDNHGTEVDLIIDQGSDFIPIEIKATETLRADFKTNLEKLKKYSGFKKGYCLYNGDLERTMQDISFLNWKKFTV